MKQIKLKSLLKEDEMKAKAMWNRLDADSREDILMRFIKNPNDIEKAVMAKWDYLPDYVASNKDFQDALTTGKGLRETNIKMVDQGYAQDFYKIKSDIVSSWNDTKVIEADIKGYLELAHESGGPKLVKEAMNAIVGGVNNAKPLLRQLKGTSPADVDLAETKSTKLSSLVKEVRGTGPISKLVRDKYGVDVLNAVYELEETLLSVGAFKNEMADIADIVFEILDAAYDEGYYDGQTQAGSTD